MEEELIKFDTAKLAKEKGVNFSLDKRVYNASGFICDVDYDTSLIDEDIPLLTQSLLQRWLREKHSIHIEIPPSYWEFDEASKLVYFVEAALFNETTKVATVTKVGYTNPEEDHKLFSIYEEALEEGLLAALKLIKI